MYQFGYLFSIFYFLFFVLLRRKVRFLKKKWVYEIGFMKVAIHYYGRLAAKQGWRFDSTYEHKDENGEPIPFVFVLGSGKVSSSIYINVFNHLLYSVDYWRSINICIHVIYAIRET